MKVIDVEVVDEEPTTAIAVSQPTQLVKQHEAEGLEVLETIKALDYTTAEGREEASDALGEVKQKIAGIDEIEDSIAGPIAEGLKKLRALFKRGKAPYVKAEKQIKQGIAAGMREAERLAALALQAGHEAGDAEAMGDVELDKPTGITLRALPRVRYTDAKLLCRERPDLTEPCHALVLAELEAGRPVPGAELYFEDSVTKR